MRSTTILATLFAVATFAAPATAQTHYQPLAASSDWTLDSTDGGPAVRKAIAETSWPEGTPLMEGWVSRWVYMRLHDDKQVYFVLVDEDAADEKYVCRVTFDSFPPTNSNRDADATVARLGALCEREKRDTLGAAEMRAISPGQPGGPRSGKVMEYSLAEGTRLAITHIENTGLWLPSLPPEIAVAPLVIGSLPTARDAASGRHERFWYVREEDGRWGVSVHFGHGQDLGRSGCFIRNLSDPMTPPSGAWLTAASLDWCRGKQQAYLDANPETVIYKAVAPPPERAPAPQN